MRHPQVGDRVRIVDGPCISKEGTITHVGDVRIKLDGPFRPGDFESFYPLPSHYIPIDEIRKD